MLFPKSDAMYHVAFSCTEENKFMVKRISYNSEIELSWMKVDGDENSSYYSEAELPVWMREKISILMALPIGDQIKTIGKHVRENVFWVYQEDDK